MAGCYHTWAVGRLQCQGCVNLDNTALFFRMFPNKSLSFKKRRCLGGKVSKDRITVLVGCSADGSGIRCCTVVRTKFRLKLSNFMLSEFFLT